MNGHAASQLHLESQPVTVPACYGTHHTGNGVHASALHSGMQQAQEQAGLQHQREQPQQQQHGEQQQQLSSTSTHGVGNHEAAAEQLEAQHVHQVYDAIASHFSATRFAVWPKVRVTLPLVDASWMLVLAEALVIVQFSLQGSPVVAT